jgi:hypothetical protein
MSAQKILLGIILIMAIAVLFVESGFAQGTAPGNSSVTPAVYTQGQVLIGGTMSCDLDRGLEILHTDLRRDFFWSQQTDVERYLEPRNGAQFHVIGIVDFASITYSDLVGYVYSTDPINGSDNEFNQIPVGTIVAAITNSNRYSKFRIDIYGYDLTITWVTYHLPFPAFLPLMNRN